MQGGLGGRAPPAGRAAAGLASAGVRYRHMLPLPALQWAPGGHHSRTPPCVIPSARRHHHRGKGAAAAACEQARQAAHRQLGWGARCAGDPRLVQGACQHAAGRCACAVSFGAPCGPSPPPRPAVLPPVQCMQEGSAGPRARATAPVTPQPAVLGPALLPTPCRKCCRGWADSKTQSSSGLCSPLLTTRNALRPSVLQAVWPCAEVATPIWPPDPPQAQPLWALTAGCWWELRWAPGRRIRSEWRR